MKEKSHLAKHLQLCSLVDERRAVVVHHVIKAFNIAFHNIFGDKLKKEGLEKCTARWIENYLIDQTQRAVINVHLKASPFECPFEGQSLVVYPRC